jgi:hypothetical protein
MDLKQRSDRLFRQYGVFISEVSAVQEIKSDDNDWIELSNGSGAAVDLTGWTISVDRPSGEIHHRGPDHRGGRVSRDRMHVPRDGQRTRPRRFGISPAGETIVL